jgi:hypothetical protein
MRALLVAGFLTIATTSPLLAQQPAPELSLLRQVGPSIYRCWRPPAGSAGQELTVVMSFKRNGEVLGRPRISHSLLTGSTQHQKEFVTSVLDAIAACTPLHLSQSLGSAMAGRPFAMRFLSKPRELGV